VNVTDNHFAGDFFGLNQEDSSFKIAIELSFQDREFVFHELSSLVYNFIEVMSHFLAVSTADNLIFPGTDRDYRIGVEVFPDQPVNRFRIVTSIHDVTIGLPKIMTLSE
jgi:hypothetical protein